MERITIEALPPGAAGTWRTLAWMKAAVRGEVAPDYSGWRDEQIRRKAVAITGGMPGHDFDSEVRALLVFVRDHIRYRRDPINTERVQDAARTLELNSGDCDDKVVLLATLLATLGWLPRFVVQSQDGVEFDHVYLEVLDERNGAWLALDPTADGQAGLPTAEVGWRNPAQREETYLIFSEVEPMSTIAGLGELDYLTGNAGSLYGSNNAGPWREEPINRAIDVLGAYASRSPYISPDDPRYRGSQRPIGYPAQYSNTDQLHVSTFGTQVPWWMWAVVGALAGAYFLGKGRR